MKALTVHQPWATLITTPQEELPTGWIHKRIENRSRNMRYRGPLLIHAGKSEKSIHESEALRAAGVLSVFGEIVGIVEVIDCVAIKINSDSSTRSFPLEVVIRYPWIVRHVHAEGPFCIVLDNALRFATPIPFKGKQGLFNVDDAIVADALNECGWNSVKGT